jgi:hypothetical protein
MLVGTKFPSFTPCMMMTSKLVMSSLTMMSAPTVYVDGHEDPLLHAVYDDDLEIGHVFAHDDERAHR